MTRFLPPRLFCALLASALLAGCAELAPIFDRKAEPERDRTPAREASRGEARTSARSDPRADSGRDQVALREGIRLYNEGDFNGAIKRPGSADIRGGSPLRTRVTALKYTAFSYCVTSRPKQCEQAFEKILKIDPDFTLEPGEQGHPLWGPAFERAKRN
ncbi:TssQ family T6SS-associated lipoprotein [Massilia sp. Se16.2.3]|uniref:TssQ family T6SS-associated lipoprotein n=1 Tax=Massilia sp. Se16.2.3 TaxID=2709303 RepID=UPI0016040762|nr:TssQ family T6SS-associated lipoprotein [Massilia sp. Se16.2.3]QNB00481.1 TssQ family T6SS-associated lipoprotein [Massilia sp. Se16.2.3]